METLIRRYRYSALISIGLPLTLACGAVRGAVFVDPAEDVGSARCLTREEARNLSVEGYRLICKDKPADVLMELQPVGADRPSRAAAALETTSPQTIEPSPISEDADNNGARAVVPFGPLPDAVAVSQADDEGSFLLELAVNDNQDVPLTSGAEFYRWIKPANEWDLIDLSMPALETSSQPGMASLGTAQLTSEKSQPYDVQRNSSMAETTGGLGSTQAVSAQMNLESKEDLASSDASSSPDDIFGQWAMVNDTDLNQLRGGFDLGQGVLVSFGLSRTVTVNGELITSTSLQIPDISHISNAQAVMLASHLGTVQLVQNGVATSVDAATRLLGAGGGTIIQNSLSNQSIKSLTVIDASVGSLGLLKSLNVQSVLRDALLGAVSGR